MAGQLKRWQQRGTKYLTGEVNIRRGDHGEVVMHTSWKTPAEESFTFTLPRGSSAERKMLRLLDQITDEQPGDAI